MVSVSTVKLAYDGVIWGEVLERVMINGILERRSKYRASRFR
jgi:hypothetical protein